MKARRASAVIPGQWAFDARCIFWVRWVGLHIVGPCVRRIAVATTHLRRFPFLALSI